jgi:hypothetical protein
MVDDAARELPEGATEELWRAVLEPAFAELSSTQPTATQDAARHAAARRFTRRTIGAALVAGVLTAVAIVVITGGAGDSSGGGGVTSATGDATVGDPAPGTSTGSTGTLAADAKAAGCTFQQFASEGDGETSGSVHYNTNPPTSGNHNPTPAADGVYKAGNSAPPENLVASLDNGRIEFQYKPGASAAGLARLGALAGEPLNGVAGYHTLLFQNTTRMTAAFAAVAWTRSITCAAMTSTAVDVMREFRKQFTDTAPHAGP